ncbi:MAG: gspD [Bacteroidetes bacterium]|nr:gspD [Bacteroidota bacterium]
MRSYIKLIAFFFFSVFTTTVSHAQSADRFISIESKLKELANESPGLNEKVELSVNGVTVQEFIRGLAATNNLNVSVDGNLNAKIFNNFSNVTVTDVLLFLCKKYDLDIAFIGNIMSVTQYVTAPPPAPKYVSRPLKITYDKNGNLLSMDLSNDSLSLVAKEITRISFNNVVYSPELAGKVLNGYIQNVPFGSALDKLAFANGLRVSATSDKFYLIEKDDAAKNSNSTASRNNGPSTQAVNLKTNGGNLITLEAHNSPIIDVLNTVSAQLKTDYFLFTEPKGNTSLNIENVTYDQFLNYLFNGTDYTFTKSGEIYLIGDRSIEGIRSTKVVNMKYRTVDKVIDYIPAELKKGVEIKTFSDQNSLILSGSAPRIQEIETFLRDIDRVVPVICIEVMIIDVNNSHTVASGIKAGLGSKPTPTSGDIFPTLDLNLGAGAINSIIDGINGFGVVNLGKVTPNFYISLQLLEQNGDVKINSTPLLSTLNGNEAKMSIGETRYYEESNTNVIPGQTTTTVQSRTFKPLNADFTMTINPIVSGDEQITLTIAVKQSSFTNQSGGKGSPYNTTSRDFQSLIRVKNQEMIMLGGLDNENKNETSSGVPILSRIPVIKWFFSSRNKTKTKSKLTIFIKPTVIY